MNQHFRRTNILRGNSLSAFSRTGSASRSGPAIAAAGAAIGAASRSGSAINAAGTNGANQTGSGRMAEAEPKHLIVKVSPYLNRMIPL